MTAPRRQPAPPLQGRSVGNVARADFRALAALLVKLDERPPLRLVPGQAAPADSQPST